MKFWVAVMILIALQQQMSVAQKIDQDRMARDIEVAENVLSTLIRQEVSPNRTFFGLEIKGYYQEGYGVTFRLPGDYAAPMYINSNGGNTIVYSTDRYAPGLTVIEGDNRPAKVSKEESEMMKLREKVEERRRASVDSARDEYNKRLIKAAKDFIIDYGDFMTQLSPSERIVVTNKNEGRSWYYRENKRTHISIEAFKSDIADFKAGKISRDQAMNKLKVINTEVVDVKEADLELFSSIIGRLYRTDLSKTFFSSENNIYYERMKDYGVVYYMEVYSSNEAAFKKFNMPTVGLVDIDQEERNKKVIELYPKFEQDLKENILEYGRTLKTLKPDEVLVFNVTLTKCKDCGIPATLELNIKNSVLTDFGSGKIDKTSALSKFTVKKGVKQ